MKVGYLGYSRRSILIVNDPDLTREIMTDPTDIYPKNDLMVGALEPLVGDSIFVSSGDRWRQAAADDRSRLLAHAPQLARSRR